MAVTVPLSRKVKKKINITRRNDGTIIKKLEQKPAEIQ
jgi:hypothetical protein